MSLKLWAMEATRGVADVLFPPRCLVCQQPLVRGESLMCLSCEGAMPLTGYHAIPFNPLHHRLAPERIERAGAMFFYHREGTYARLIHLAKYGDKPWIARQLGAKYAGQIMKENFFSGIDMLLPVPLSWLKNLKRGYNQAREIAIGVSQVTKIPVGDHLRARSHMTQTRQGSYQRFLNVSNIYQAHRGQDLAGKHVLIIDDVVTTGSTLLACVKALRSQVPDLQISILTLAATHLR